MMQTFDKNNKNKNYFEETTILGVRLCRLIHYWAIQVPSTYVIFLGLLIQSRGQWKHFNKSLQKFDYLQLIASSMSLLLKCTL